MMQSTIYVIAIERERIHWSSKQGFYILHKYLTIILFISLLAAITECIFIAKPSTIQIMSDKNILISHHCRSFATRKAIRQKGIE